MPHHPWPLGQQKIDLFFAKSPYDLSLRAYVLERQVSLPGPLDENHTIRESTLISGIIYKAGYAEFPTDREIRHTSASILIGLNSLHRNTDLL